MTKGWQSLPRWAATITYKTDNGPLEVDHVFQELEDLHDLVERGPNFFAIEKIVVTINAGPFETTPTVEEAEAQ